MNKFFNSYSRDQESELKMEKLDELMRELKRKRKQQLLGLSDEEYAEREREVKILRERELEREMKELDESNLERERKWKEEIEKQEELTRMFVGPSYNLVPPKNTDPSIWWGM